MDHLNDPYVVRQDYASEARLVTRASIYGDSEGPDATELLVSMVLDRAPTTLLEVGCGTGKLARCLHDEHGLAVTVVDVSERMVQLARGHGIDGLRADVQRLPFADASFDAVVAAWMLYHVPELNDGIAEIRRVLSVGGTLFAITNSERHLSELWRLVGIDGGESTFSAENGAQLLGDYFAHVDTRNVIGTITFRDKQAVGQYLGATIRGCHLVDYVPDLEEPLDVTRANAIFTAC